jgi:hypothetical protein
VAVCVDAGCGIAVASDGTAARTQTAGDCKINQCKGGVPVAAPDPTDKPATDGNDCTVESCDDNGNPLSTNAPAGTPCAKAGCPECQLCDGKGACCGDTTSDPKNCGSCGHDCLGGACQGGKCQPVVLVTGQPHPGAMAADATHLWWSNGACTTSCTIAKAKKDGTELVTFATGQKEPSQIVVDASGVYWVNVAGSNPPGAVMRAEKDGSGLKAIAPAEPAPQGLSVDATHVYWMTGTGSVRKAPEDGSGSPTTLAGGLSEPGRRARHGRPSVLHGLTGDPHGADGRRRRRGAGRWAESSDNARGVRRVPLLDR